MDIQSYISSGIIEQYALGILSQEETSILECVMQHNSEVQQAILEAQQTIGDLALVQSAKPSDDLKNKIAKQLIFSEEKDDASQDEGDDGKIRTLDQSSEPKKSKGIDKNYASLLAVAASLLLLVSLGWAIQNNNKKNAEIEQLVQKSNFVESQMQYVQQQNDILYNSNQIKLKGVPAHPGLIATVYLQPSNQVYLVLENLPKAPRDKEYQLWAIVDGTPVDMGLYDQAKPEKLQNMKKVKNAQAFAITLENKGGSATPTMEEMYVIGNVS